VRTISGAERTLIGGSRFDVHLRAFIRDAGGTFRDLTNVHTGRNWLLGVTIRESLDSPSATASVTLSRTVDGLTIAPGVSASSANTGGAFLDVGRELYVETACVAAGASPVAGDWRRVFWGRVDRLETGDRERIVLECRDLSGRLTDLFLEAPYQVPAVALETAIQGLLDASPLGNIVTLVTPTSPSFTIATGRAPRFDAVSVFASARQLAAQVGWDLRYRWTGAATNELRFFQPDRAKTTPDLTIGPGEYLSVRSWAAALEDVRNVVTVQYLGANGLPATEIRSNAASITAYGRRAMRLGGDTTALLSTQAQAQALGDAVLADLALPTATHQIETLYLWPAEVGDLWRFSPNAVHYDGNQDYAVVAIEHELSRDRHRTRVTARGKPAARYYGWLREGITAADVIAAAITNAAPGGNATQAEISYASSGGTLTVIRNGVAVTPGASPWVVSRPGAGAADVYEFIQTAGAVRESVLVTVYSNEMFSGGTGYVGGSGTAGRLAKWATASTLTDAVVEDDGAHFFPTVGSTRDNGTAARPWRDVRASRDVYVGGTLTVTGAVTLGTTAAAAGFVRMPNNNTVSWRNAANTADLTVGYGTDNRLYVGATQVGGALEVTGTSITGTHATTDLGLTGTRFRDGWFSRDVTVGGTIGVTGALSVSGGSLRTIDPAAGRWQLTGTADGSEGFWFGPEDTQDVFLGRMGSKTAFGLWMGDNWRCRWTATEFRPETTGAVDLGLTGARWRDGWFSRDVTVGGALTLDSVNPLRFGSTSGPALALSNSGASARIKVYGGTSDAGFIFQDSTGSATLGFLLGFVSDASMRLFASDGSAALEWRPAGGQPSSSGALDWGTTSRQWRDGFFSRDVVAGTSLAVGATPATAGTLRLPNAAWVTGRNAANSANVDLLRLNTSNELALSPPVTCASTLNVTGATTLPGGVTGRSGTRVPEIYVQSGDPGAVGAGAIWIQT
jgi:hypothetical protein